MRSSMHLRVSRTDGAHETRTLRGCSDFGGGVLPFGASVVCFLFLSDAGAFFRDMHVDAYMASKSLARNTSNLHFRRVPKPNPDPASASDF